MIIDSIENKRNILAEFLKLCPFDGISEEALEQAIEKAGLKKEYKTLIFENGCIDLLELFIDENCQEIAKIVEKQPDFANFKVRSKISFCLHALFDSQKENRPALARIWPFYVSFANFKEPNYGPRPLYLAFKHVGKIADFIWKICADKSTDFNYYTKRLTLSKIILQSFKVFLKDESENLEQTKKFIDQKIEKVMQFEKFKAKIKNHKAAIGEKLHEFLVDEKGQVKSPRRLIKDLPFFRLFN